MNFVQKINMHIYKLQYPFTAMNTSMCI